jgi:hypothetical protein
MDLISLLVIVVLLGGIIVVLKKGFNEVINGLQAIDEKLSSLAEKIHQKKD